MGCKGWKDFYGYDEELSRLPEASRGKCASRVVRGVDIGPNSQAGRGRTASVAPSVGEVAPLFPQLEILGFIGQGGTGVLCRRGAGAGRMYWRGSGSDWLLPTKTDISAKKPCVHVSYNMET
jgi:hypothetical protein